MSQEGMRKFTELIAKDPEIAEKVKSAGADVDALVQLAAEQGCDITVKDFHALAAQIHNKLSEEDLDKIVGGGVIQSITNAVSSVTSAVNNITTSSDTIVAEAVYLAATVAISA